MKKIILHVGTHKTGTTSIQEALVQNRPQLAAQGVLYGATGRLGDRGKRKHASLVVAVQANDDAAFEAERAAILSEFEASGCHTLILSEEGFFYNKEARWLDRYQALTRGYEVEVICYLRRQDLFLEAAWIQRIKIGVETETIDLFHEQDVSRQRVRYDHILIDGWQRFARVRAINFDEAKKKGAVASFTAACGLEPLPEQTRNITPSVNCALMMMHLNRTGVPYHKPRIMRAFAGDRHKRALGAALRRQILARAAPGNARLEAEYGIRFSPDLPEEQEAPVTTPDPIEMARAMARLSARTVRETRLAKEAVNRKAQAARKAQGA